MKEVLKVLYLAGAIALSGCVPEKKTYVGPINALPNYNVGVTVFVENGKPIQSNLRIFQKEGGKNYSVIPIISADDYEADGHIDNINPRNLPKGDTLEGILTIGKLNEALKEGAEKAQNSQ